MTNFQLSVKKKKKTREKNTFTIEPFHPSHYLSRQSRTRKKIACRPFSLFFTEMMPQKHIKAKSARNQFNTVAVALIRSVLKEEQKKINRKQNLDFIFEI